VGPVAVQAESVADSVRSLEFDALEYGTAAALDLRQPAAARDRREIIELDVIDVGRNRQGLRFPRSAGLQVGRRFRGERVGPDIGLCEGDRACANV